MHILYEDVWEKQKLHVNHGKLFSKKKKLKNDYIGLTLRTGIVVHVAWLPIRWKGEYFSTFNESKLGVRNSLTLAVFPLDSSLGKNKRGHGSLGPRLYDFWAPDGVSFCKNGRIAVPSWCNGFRSRGISFRPAVSVGGITDIVIMISDMREKSPAK